MACCYPVQAFKTGTKTVNGKDEYIRCADNAYPGYLPITKLRKKINLAEAPHAVIPGEGLCLTEPQEQPCGKCVGCRLDNAKDWQTRLCLQLQYTPECYFVTLTYDDYHLPFSLETGEPVLHYPDVQKFLKRLRKKIGPCMYFGCGEYGSEENTLRPHYHILVFGHLTKSELVGVRKFLCAEISDCWKFGHTVVEDICIQNVSYVCGYVEKKQADPDWDKYPTKPFCFMSTKPAIGAMYFIDNYDSIKSTKKVYGVFDSTRKGSSRPLPRYFKRLLDDYLWYQSWKDEQKKLIQSRLKVEAAVAGDSNRSHIGDTKEALRYQMIEKRRRKTL